MNQHGFLFGGDLLQWIDEFAWITATVEYPGLKFVTVAMENVQFKRSIDVGEVLRFVVDRVGTGHTSVRYRVRAHGIVRQPDAATVLSMSSRPSSRRWSTAAKNELTQRPPADHFHA
jgi:acyl-CoA hydrolase